jgi:hypothetical protein
MAGAGSATKGECRKKIQLLHRLVLAQLLLRAVESADGWHRSHTAVPSAGKLGRLICWVVTRARAAQDGSGEKPSVLGNSLPVNTDRVQAPGLSDGHKQATTSAWECV